MSGIVQRADNTIEASLTGEFLTEPTLDLWCDTCMLPSAVAADIAVFVDGDLLTVVHAERCHDCGTLTSSTT